MSRGTIVVSNGSAPFAQFERVYNFKDLSWAETINLCRTVDRMCKQKLPVLILSPSSEALK